MVKRRFLILNQLKLWYFDVRFYVTVFLKIHVFMLTVSLEHEKEDHELRDAEVPCSIFYFFI